MNTGINSTYVLRCFVRNSAVCLYRNNSSNKTTSTRNFYTSWLLWSSAGQARAQRRNWNRQRLYTKYYRILVERRSYSYSRRSLINMPKKDSKRRQKRGKNTKIRKYAALLCGLCCVVKHRTLFCCKLLHVRSNRSVSHTSVVRGSQSLPDRAGAGDWLAISGGVLFVARDEEVRPDWLWPALL